MAPHLQQLDRSGSASTTSTTNPSTCRTVRRGFTENVRDVYFDYDKSDVRDDQKSTLADAASFLKTNSSVKFSIEGHCDERGSEGTTWAWVIAGPML